MKKNVIRLLVGFGLVIESLSLASTSSNSNTSNKSRPLLNVDCSFTGPSADLCEKAANEWSKLKNVRVKISRETLTSTEKLIKYTKLLETKSKDIDVFGVDVVWPAVLHKSLLDLEPYLKADSKNFLPVYISNNTVNGRLLAVPLSLSMGILYYRKDLLSRYQLKVPETWEELTVSAKKIQDEERKRGRKSFVGYLFQGKAYEGLTCNALEWIASYNGGNLLTQSGRPLVNTVNVLEALKTATSWIGTISPPEVLQYAERETHEIFKKGDAAFLRAWHSAWPATQENGSQVKDQVGVALLPRGGKRGIHPSMLGGWSVAVASHTQHPALAADLIRYMTRPEAQKKWALVSGNGPALQSLYRDSEILKSAPQHSILVPVLPHAVIRPSRTTRNLYPEFSQAVFGMIHEVLEGKISRHQAVSDLQNQLEQLSVRWRK